MLPSRVAHRGAWHYIAANMKTIDIKSLIIGFLLSAVMIFLAAGFRSAANADPISVRLVEIDRGIGSDWDAVEVKGR